MSETPTHKVVLTHGEPRTEWCNEHALPHTEVIDIYAMTMHGLQLVAQPRRCHG